LGRSKTHSIKHGIVGAKIAQSLNLPLKVIKIIERHIGGGITMQEAKNLGLTCKSFVPKTLEEKIVAYADKLIKGSKTITIEESIEKFKEELGANHPAIKRIESLHNEIFNLCKKNSGIEQKSLIL
jgi:uncharacterized protein